MKIPNKWVTDVSNDLIYDVEIPTASLIAELEKRRPNCRDCARVDGNHGCPCMWSNLTDNFKPTK